MWAYGNNREIGTMTDEMMISVAEAAKRLGRHKNSLHRLISRLGMETVRIKTEQARGQSAAHITEEDFCILSRHVGSESQVGEDTEAQNSGYFYIVQLEPELDPKRLKFGFATTVQDRLRKHMTAAPLSRLLGSWPCKLTWEKAAIDCLSENSEQLYTEVFRVEDVEMVLSRADAFFELMPEPT